MVVLNIFGDLEEIVIVIRVTQWHHPKGKNVHKIFENKANKTKAK